MFVEYLRLYKELNRKGIKGEINPISDNQIVTDDCWQTGKIVS